MVHLSRLNVLMLSITAGKYQYVLYNGPEMGVPVLYEALGSFINTFINIQLSISKVLFVTEKI